MKPDVNVMVLLKSNTSSRIKMVLSAIEMEYSKTAAKRTVIPNYKMALRYSRYEISQLRKRTLPHGFNKEEFSQYYVLYSNGFKDPYWTYIKEDTR